MKASRLVQFLFVFFVGMCCLLALPVLQRHCMATHLDKRLPKRQTEERGRWLVTSLKLRMGPEAPAEDIFLISAGRVADSE